MNLGEAAMVAAITVSVAGVSYATLNSAQLTRTAQATADRATCRAVNAAIVAYVATNERAPATTADLTSYVDGDITAYRIQRGVAAGPGCRG